MEAMYPDLDYDILAHELEAGEKERKDVLESLGFRKLEDEELKELEEDASLTFTMATSKDIKQIASELVESGFAEEGEQLIGIEFTNQDLPLKVVQDQLASLADTLDKKQQYRIADALDVINRRIAQMPMPMRSEYNCPFCGESRVSTDDSECPSCGGALRLDTIPEADPAGECASCNAWSQGMIDNSICDSCGYNKYAA